MTEYAQDFEVFQGDNKEITIPITDEAGAAKTISGSTQKWEAFDPDTDEQLICELINVLQVAETDMTIFFRKLAQVKISELDKPSGGGGGGDTSAAHTIAPSLDAY